MRLLTGLVGAFVFVAAGSAGAMTYVENLSSTPTISIDTPRFGPTYTGTIEFAPMVVQPGDNIVFDVDLGETLEFKTRYEGEGVLLFTDGTRLGHGQCSDPN
jgi:uncharacterized membrane protein